MSILRVAVFGPSDSNAHKEHLRMLIDRDPSLNRTARHFDLTLKSFSGIDVPSGRGRAQELINRYIAEVQPDLSIFIFVKSFGTDAGLGMTGTEEEWSVAVDTLAARADFDIAVYFSEEGLSKRRLKAFRKRIEHEYFAYYTVYRDAVDLDAHLRNKLTNFICDRASKRDDRPQTTAEETIEALAASPFSMTSYPRSLPGGEELPRLELDSLVNTIRNNASSATVILGERGSGKSALLGKLDEELRAAGVAVLSIKADMLDPSVAEVAELDRALRLPLGFTASIQLIAATRPVVIIVDQLDALADVLDRRTERLNVLLNAIRSVSGLSNVHVVVSSRPFEYHHDVRLRSMSAESLELQLPAWTDVAPILQKHEYPADSASEPVHELLRNPWTLNAFLRLGPKTIDFDSLFSILEELWDSTVGARNAPVGTRELVAHMVETMTAEEVLWIPRALSDAYAEARDYLQHHDIVAIDESHRRIGFRHQSFFEFARVRQFASESLADYVLRSSGGLAIRPVVLAGLAYLRGTFPTKYERELLVLWRSPLRMHLRALIVDFIATQSTPLSTEIGIVTEMLQDDRQGPRALTAIASYAPWFPVLRHTAAFSRWLRRPPDDAKRVIGLLVSHGVASPDDVLEVIEREWLPKPEYDPLSFTVMFNMEARSQRALSILLRIVGRSSQQGVYDLAHQALDTDATFSAQLLRAELDRRLSDLLATGKSGYELERAIARLLDDENHTTVFTDLAATSPEAHVRWVFPLVMQAIAATAEQQPRNFQQYRDAHIDIVSFDIQPLEALVYATIAALEQLAAADTDKALAVIEPCLDSDIVEVHALATFVFSVIAPTRPSVVLDYLIGDPRHLAIGSTGQAHYFSRRLIESVIPHLDGTQRAQLESAILAYGYYIAPDDELDEEWRAEKPRWNREHRLFLLQSFPDELLSPGGLSAKRALQSEFPRADESIFGRVIGGVVEALHDLRALAAMKNDEIVEVFNELPDETGWNHPRRWSTDEDRIIGGTIQQSRVLAELAEKEPERCHELAKRFRPGDQERPAGAVITGLSKTTFDPVRQVELILDLARKGFASDDFVTDAAYALERLAERLQGLPDDALLLLHTWLNEVQAPSPDLERKTADTPSDHALIFGMGGMFMQPHGRGPVIEAIASGYLEREPPDVKKWIAVVRERLDKEDHPRVWVMAIRRFFEILKEYPKVATELLSSIFQRLPDVLREPFTWRIIAQWMRAFEPPEAFLGWLDILGRFEDSHSQQAIGELLYLYAAVNPQARDRVLAHLANGNDRHIVRGLAFAAAHWWDDVPSRTLGAEVLTSEIESWPEDAARTLRDLRIEDLDDLTQRVYRAAAADEKVLLAIFPDIGEEIEPRTMEEPEFVADIARAVVNAPTAHVEGTLGPIHRGNVPEVMTSIALTLHRMPEPRFADVGLELFEKLLDANLREARAALEVLDRKPTRRLTTSRPRRPRRPRRRPKR